MYKYGRSALMLAISNKNNEGAGLLIQAGADLNIVNKVSGPSAWLPLPAPACLPAPP